MRGKKIKSLIMLSAFLVSSALALVYNNIYYVSADSFVNENIATKKRLQEKKKSLEKELKESKSNLEKESNNKDELDKQIELVKSQIDTSNQYILELETEIESSQKKIGELQSDIDEKIKALKSSLRSIYIAGDASAIDIILKAKTFDDFLDKAEIVKSVSDTVSGLVNQLKSNMDEIEEQKAGLEKKMSESQQEKEDLIKSQEELKSLIEESNRLISAIKREEQEKEREIDENDTEMKQIDAKVQRYYEEQRRKAEEEQRKKAEEEKKKAAQQKPSKQPPKQQSGSSSSGSSPLPSPEVSKGGFTWPVPGFYYISSGYYDTQGRGGKTHGAIDIAGGGIYGAKIVAAADGTIIQSSASGWGGGYGTYAIIDHGGGKQTRYGHMSVLSVSTGQSVKKGQVIGYVGSTGMST